MMKRGTLFFWTLFFTLITAHAFAAEPLWNQFRGPNHDNHSFSTGLLKTWPGEGPKLSWKLEGLGAGYSNLTFDEKRMYTMGDIGPDCCVHAFDKNTREKLWSTPIGKSGELGGYHGPKSTPAVDGKFVFAFSQFGDFACVEAETGKLLWKINVLEDLDGRFMSNWGFSSSPVFVEDFVVLPIGGEKGTLLAYSKDGKQIWRTSDLRDPAPYSSVVPVKIHGIDQLLLFSEAGPSGIDPKTGKILWTAPRPGNRIVAVCSDPIYKDGVVFVSSAYNMGCNGYKIEKQGNSFTTEEIYADRRMQNHHGGIVLIGDHLYFTTDRNLVCMEIASGEISWQERCVGKGSVSYADGHIIVRSEAADGTIALVEANPKEYVEKGRFNQPDRTGKQSWTYPTIVEGKMYIRDQGLLLCFDLKDADL